MNLKYALLLLVAPCLLLSEGLVAQQDQQWVADQSTLSYHMSHPLHQVDGISHAAKGKGICHIDQCQILIAVPVKTFGSGDTNRDLHMIEAVRGAQYPMIVVHAFFKEAELQQSLIHADIEVEFAGKTAHYDHVEFQRATKGGEVHIEGTIPLTCSDFKINRPSFLTVPIKDEIPVRIDMTWRSMQSP